MGGVCVVAAAWWWLVSQDDATAAMMEETEATKERERERLSSLNTALPEELLHKLKQGDAFHRRETCFTLNLILQFFFQVWNCCRGGGAVDGGLVSHTHRHTHNLH